MNNHFSKITAPTKFNLTPLGEGTVTEVLHEGQTFHLYRADLGGQDVVLKTPSPSLTGDALFVKSISVGSEEMVRTSQGIDWLNWSDSKLDPIKVATWALLVESQIINLAAGDWNHHVIAMGTWDGLSKNWNKETWSVKEPLDLRFLPVLVMPYHNAVAFSTLPHSLKRLLFPQMMPALWDALCKTPHGDLSESNILINQTQNIFHIIDPGIVLSSDMHQHSGDTYISIFITTRANYPLIPPFNRQSHDATGLISFIKEHILDWNMRGLPEDMLYPASPSVRPAACDLLALGIIYYRILTGKEIFLGTSILPEKPAWQNSYVTPQNENTRVYMQLIDSLSDGYVQKELDKANITEAEKRLAYSLLNLEIVDKGHLLHSTAR